MNQREIDYYTKYLGQLVGCTVTGIAQTPEGEFMGLVFKGGQGRFIAWIQCDPEGNGAGHLEIEKQQ